MSERMNKERAREVLEKAKTNLNENPYFLKSLTDNRDFLQALDIAIDSLDNEWVDVSDAKKPEKDEKVLIQVDDYIHTATYDKDEDVWKLNYNEYSMHSTKFKNFYDIAKWKKVEPYERKE